MQKIRFGPTPFSSLSRGVAIRTTQRSQRYCCHQTSSHFPDFTTCLVFVVAQNGYTPVLWAAEKGHATAVQALVEAGANVHAARRDGATALALAVQSMDATDDAKDDAAEKKLDSIKRIFEKLRPGIVSTPAVAAIEEQQSKTQLLPLIAGAFLSPAVLETWLGSGASPTGLKAEIGALLRSTGLSEDVKGRLTRVRTFLDYNARLLREGGTIRAEDGASQCINLPHVFKQLAAQEPAGVWSSQILETDHTAPDAPYLIACLNNQSISRPLFTIEGVACVRSVVYSKCGSQLARSEGHEVVVCDPVSGFELRRFHGHRGEVDSVSFHPNGVQVASGSHDKTVRIWNVETGTCEWTVNVDSSVYSVAYSPDGTTLAAGLGFRSNSVLILDAQSGKIKSSLSGHRYVPFPIFFSIFESV